MLSPTRKQSSLAPADDDDQARQLVMGRWRSSLASGLRTAVACIIVGLVSLYAPPSVRRHITFPAFSYVVTVIIVTDATLGTALRGAVSALHATLMGAAPSVLALWLAHRTGAAESVPATAAVVALTTFAVALPESAGPVAKRIALGQIIIIYVAKFRQGERPTLAFALVHPANVVACTALGVAAALLAVALPWPRLATSEAREKSRAYKELAAERVRVMVDAFLVGAGKEAAAPCGRQRRWQMAACMSKAERLASACTAILRRINSIKEDLQWERPLVQAARRDVSQELQHKMMMEMEMPLTGMQIALAIQTRSSTTTTTADQHGDAHRHHETDLGLITAMTNRIRLALLTTHHSDNSAGLFGTPYSAPTTMTLPQSHNAEELAPLLFLFSLHQLHRDAINTSSYSDPQAAAALANAKQVAPAAATAPADDDSSQEQEEQDDKEEQPPCPSTTTKNGSTSSATTLLGIIGIGRHHRRRRLMAATKCGFSLGLAVLLGLLFNNDHGFWSGLIVATTMAAGRDSTWAVAVARAHGTALGSIYGVLGCLLISQRHLLTMDLRLLALLPWMVLATFLKRSRAYGPAGGVAAALSVVIIMGRRYDEAPMAFTVARLVETFIGISCAVVADLVFQPGARPSVQARAQLAACIAAIRDCFAAPPGPEVATLRRVHQQLALLRKYTAEARSEPTYLWLPPFPAACYDEMEGSLTRMAQLLHLYVQALSSSQLDLDFDDAGGDGFSRVVSSSLNHCLRLATNSPSLEDEASSQGHDDLEAGHGTKCSCCKEEETPAPEEVAASFLAHAREAQPKEDDEEAEGLVVCCVASMALCMGEIIKEALRLEAHILDLRLQPH
ncbi:hypothetical protein ACP70R_049763 [Stipagrostis hirtigluma subsp. patula]